ncbi:MAG: VanZ family protein [Oscillospiraceae bacterium]|nr:VanZ family protein [Oscillospiraceae bacterium]
MQRKKPVFLTLSLLATAAWIFFILERSAQVAEQSSQESGQIWNLLNSIIPGITVHQVRKLAHFTEYFVLGGLLWTDFHLLNKDYLTLSLCSGLFVGGSDEYFQTFIPGRSGQLKDVLIDFSGVAIAVLSLYMMWRLRAAAEKRRERELA